MKGKIRESLFGETGYIESICLKLYGLKDHGKVSDIQLENGKRYRSVLVAFVILLLLKMLALGFVADDKLIMNGKFVQGISRPEKGVFGVTLVANMEEGENSFEKEIPFSIPSLGFQEETMKTDQNINQENFQQIQERKLLELTSHMDKSGKMVIPLPSETEEGIQIKWTEKTNKDWIYLLILFLFSFSMVYLARYKKIKSMEKQAKKSVVAELPEFINMMLLLLNAGLIFTSAFEKYINNLLNNKRETYFASQMIQVRNRAEETNSPLILELKDFAERTEVRPFIRTVNVISDNIYKGSFLVEKLELESDLIWEHKRKNAEENNRIAETKLSFPLAIHLIVLIGITIAPALIST